MQPAAAPGSRHNGRFKSENYRGQVMSGAMGSARGNGGVATNAEGMKQQAKAAGRGTFGF